ncbi:splicing factor 3B subunit 2-like [Mytilus californianus]|uniref:splicing factor 3B subunit 2-like n=1 Tax=Mytilus californianus TaxID=6549 RepID=UPI0022481037|nr:splicing factor 3B subunit 2-like [Mytilus californianus]
MMERVRHQQQLIEAERSQKQMMEQQQLLQQQQAAINQVETERRMKEAELLRTQQIAMMEAQKEEQKRIQEEQMRQQQGPPVPRPPPVGPPASGPPQQPPPSLMAQPIRPSVSNTGQQPLMQSVGGPPPLMQSGGGPPPLMQSGGGPPPLMQSGQDPTSIPSLMQTTPGPPIPSLMQSGMSSMPPHMQTSSGPPSGPPFMPPGGGPSAIPPLMPQAPHPQMSDGPPRPPMQQPVGGQRGPPPVTMSQPQRPQGPPPNQFPPQMGPQGVGPPPRPQNMPPRPQPPPQMGQGQQGPPMIRPPQGPPQSLMGGPPGSGPGGRPPGPPGPPTSVQMNRPPGPPTSVAMSRPPGPPTTVSMSRPPGPPGQPMEKLPPPKFEPPEEEKQKEVKLPQALEKILAFKDARAQEVGVSPEELEEMNKPKVKEETEEIDEDIGYETYDIDEETDKPDASKESKNRRKKKKKKKSKKNRLMQQQLPPKPKETTTEETVNVEYVQEQLELDPSDPNYYTFAKIFEAFKISEAEKPKEKVLEEKKEAEKKPEEVKPRGMFEEEDDEDEKMETDENKEDHPKMSKKKLKKMTRLSVAQLKQLVGRPDVVEMHDVTAQDPRLLVCLKATRNTVPVPRHWCFKRKYLQGKRGIEKPPFELPDFIKATGIMEMREALQEKEDQKTLKSKMREKIRPKMGKIDIDYQKLHDAFFRWQTKPKMTIHGDLYYEGKEFETRLKEKKPGNLSDELRTALGMPIGHNSEKFPPPWLIAMQRYGPPPSYPNLKIPGLTAAIPEGCSFGYHAGGWGKPPVDENGKPLYGDVFGTQSADFQAPVKEEEIDKSLWGELEEESSSEEESSEEEEELPDETGLITPGPEGLVTPSGITSVPLGVETPDMIELRKKRIEDAMDQGGETPALYTILPEKKQQVGAAMMGSSHIYDMTGVQPGAKKTDKVSTEGIEVALNPEELDLDTAAMQAKYDETMREQQSQLAKEDLSDMVAEHAAKQKKRKKQQDSGKSSKKYKEFKF